MISLIWSQLSIRPKLLATCQSSVTSNHPPFASLRCNGCVGAMTVGSPQYGSLFPPQTHIRRYAGRFQYSRLLASGCVQYHPTTHPLARVSARSFPSSHRILPCPPPHLHLYLKPIQSCIRILNSCLCSPSKFQLRPPGATCSCTE